MLGVVPAHPALTPPWCIALKIKFSGTPQSGEPGWAPLASPSSEVPGSSGALPGPSPTSSGMGGEAEPRAEGTGPGVLCVSEQLFLLCGGRGRALGGIWVGPTGLGRSWAVGAELPSRPSSLGSFPAGYGQDLAGFGQGFSDPSQQPPSYGGPSVPGSGGPPAGGSGFGRGQNHNVQGFHPYRR